jgi:hypothetical protein
MMSIGALLFGIAAMLNAGLFAFHASKGNTGLAVLWAVVTILNVFNVCMRLND